MSKFKVGDEIVCVKRSDTNWYSVGDVHTISSGPISAWDNETCEDYVGYNVLAYTDKTIWIDSRDFDLIVEEPIQADETNYSIMKLQEALETTYKRISHAEEEWDNLDQQIVDNKAYREEQYKCAKDLEQTISKLKGETK